MRALQQDIEELKRVNDELQKENQSLREQLSVARSGNSNIRTHPSQSLHLPLSLSIPPVCQVGRGVAGPHDPAVMQSLHVL